MNNVIELLDKYLVLGLAQEQAIAQVAHELRMSADEVLMEAVGYTPEENWSDSG